MTALILNSGLGSRMQGLTAHKPKCMVGLAASETIVTRQLRLLQECGIRDAVMTTGPFEDILRAHTGAGGMQLQIRYVHNPVYAQTNYIYSMYLAREFLDDDILLMHGDLVFEKTVLQQIAASGRSAVCVSTTADRSPKDFKAVVAGGRVLAIGTEFMEDSVACQPLYMMKKSDFGLWMQAISNFCARGETGCYAEKALNQITGQICLQPCEYADRLCTEIDTEVDLENVAGALRAVSC